LFSLGFSLRFTSSEKITYALPPSNLNESVSAPKSG
jgi:hypothetical protein